MVFAKRITLFLIVNAFVLLTVSFLLSILGIQPYLEQNGLNYESLLMFCLVWGFGGAFVSLAISKITAKWMMGVQIISPNSRDENLAQLYRTVEKLAQSAGLPKTPEVGIYDSPEMNAFATGPTRSRSLVAVSTGLLEKMDTNSVHGVLAHEIAHIANGDMVTMTLLQGVVNAFVMFLARVIAHFISGAISRNESSSGTATGVYFLIVFVLEILFMVLGSIIVAWFSRWREYRADAGGAKLAGPGAMIAALSSLQNEFKKITGADEKSGVQYLMVSGKSGSFLRLFASHPPLEVRIQRLKQANNC